ncbi:MAG TPA: alcohol dehydrogenase catalytic domain-containing protein [Candidatus Limnocylindrales bacterium]|nr:alcohol dehydrogenase catalytic domain-containing protein [Candidatus Limnocylindrales bacterium]
MSVEAAPSTALAWNVYGAGIDHIGRDGRPETVEVPRPGPDQLLIRVDAVGLCFSDIKLLRLGGEHPKLYGRDLATDPTRLGHETSVTVIEVGEDLRDRYQPGQRLAIQPDIYVNGRSTAYGYTIPGGLIQYHVIGPEVLAADDGAYVVPIDDRMGYAETALTEPWACVEAAYTQRRRLRPMPGGRMWILALPGGERSYRFGEALAGASEIVVTGASPVLLADLRSAAGPEATVVERDIDDAIAAGPYDDVIAIGRHDPATVARAGDAVGFRGTINLVSDEPLTGPVEIDVGRLHYHYVAWLGTSGTDVSAAYGEARNRAELRAGGVTVVVGAAGPMGQMHIERALAMADGPRLVIGVDLDADRLAAARAKLAPVATARGRELRIEALGREPDALATFVRDATGGRGADDVVVTAPSGQAVVSAAAAMAPDGMLVLFAGVPVGTRVALDLSPIFLHRAQYTGTSGSRIEDQALVVRKTVAGELEPRRALAAVGGMETAAVALQALVDGRYPGKIVVFPQLTGLPLTAVADLADDPEIGPLLGPDGSWTIAAERALFARAGRSAVPT